MDNASNWLRLLFHALTCPPQAAPDHGEASPACCALGEDCVMAKQLLAHMACCTQPDTCPQCRLPRQLLLHFASCTDATCGMCEAVAADLGSRPVDHRRRRHYDCTPQDAYDVHQGHCYRVAGNEATDCEVNAALTPSPKCVHGPHHSASSPREAPDQLGLAVQHLTGLLHYGLSRGAVVAGSHNGTAGGRTTRGAQLWRHTLGCSSVAPCTAGRDGHDKQYEEDGGGDTDDPHACPVVGSLCQLSKCLLLHRVTCAHPTCGLCDPVCAHFRRPLAQASDDGSGLAAVQVEDLDLGFYADMMSALEVGISGMRI